MAVPSQHAREMVDKLKMILKLLRYTPCSWKNARYMNVLLASNALGDEVFELEDITTICNS